MMQWHFLDATGDFVCLCNMIHSVHCWFLKRTTCKLFHLGKKRCFLDLFRQKFDLITVSMYIYFENHKTITFVFFKFWYFDIIIMILKKIFLNACIFTVSRFQNTRMIYRNVKLLNRKILLYIFLSFLNRFELRCNKKDTIKVGCRCMVILFSSLERIHVVCRY